MKHKIFEIRDRGTCIPVLAIQAIGENAVEREVLEKCGYPVIGPFQDVYNASIIVVTLRDLKCDNDPYGRAWFGSRTMVVAHEHICNNFATLESGSMIDVRVLLGEEKEPAKAEVCTVGNA